MHKRAVNRRRHSQTTLVQLNVHTLGRLSYNFDGYPPTNWKHARFLQCFSQFSRHAHARRRTHNHTKTSRKRNKLWRGTFRQRRGGDQQRYRHAHMHAAIQAYTHTDNAAHTNQTKRETGVSGRVLGNPATTVCMYCFMSIACMCSIVTW